MTTDNTQQIVSDILKVNEFLLSSKGFGPLGTGKAQRVMYSAILVAQEYKKQCLNQIMDMATINSVTSIIIAQQVAVSAAIAASAGASAASN